MPSEGYDFVGWEKDGETVSTEASLTITVKLVNEYTAKFAKQTFDVTYMAFGNVLDTKEFEYGDAFAPTNAVLYGYKINGWCLDQALKEPVPENYEVKADVTVYADAELLAPAAYEGVYDGQEHVLSAADFADTLTDLHSVSFQWYRRNKSTGEYEAIPGATGVEYSVKNVADSGMYGVAISAKRNDTGAMFDSSSSANTLNSDILEVAVNITPRPITITSDSAEKIYDGQPLTCDTFTWTEYNEAEQTGLVEGHTLTVAITEDSTITNVGTLTNAIKSGSVVIKDENGVSVKSNYAVTKVEGTLTVTPRPVVLVAGSAEKVYDGQPLTCEDVIATTAKLYEVSGPVEGHVFTATMTEESTVTNVNDSPVDNNIKNSGTTQAPICEFVVMSSDGDEIPAANYMVVGVKKGTLTVTKRALTITADSAEKVYDGEPLTCETVTADEFDAEAGTGLVPGHTVTVTIESAITDVGTLTNAIKSGSVVIKDENGVNVKDNYKITKADGELTVTPRPIILAAGSAEKVFDGTKLTCADVEAKAVEGEEASGLVEGHVFVSATLTAQSYRVDAGETANVIKNSGTEEEPIYEFVIKSSDAEDAVDVSANYIVSDTEDGTLTVAKRPVVITADDASKVYDGTALTCDTVTASAVEGNDDSGLVSTHKITAVTMTKDSTITDAGTQANTIESVTIMNKNGASGSRDITANYEITFEAGTLTVTPADMVVSASGYSGSVDGAAHGITVNVTEPSSGYKIYYSASESSEGSVIPLTYSTAGTRTVYFTVRSDDGNYNDYTGSATVALTASSSPSPLVPPTTTYYSVVFDTNGGSAVSAQVVAGGSKASKPKDPTKTDSTFVGWYADKDLTTEYDFDSAVNKDITIYAKWNEIEKPEEIIPNKYVLDLSGASVSGSNVSGTGKIVKTEGNQPVGTQYVYIVVNFERPDGSTWAVAGTYLVNEDGSFDLPTINGITDKLTSVTAVGLDAKVGSNWAGHNITAPAKITVA